MHKNKTRIIYKIKTLLVVLVIFCSFAVLNTSFAQSFIGPSCAAGQCQGKIGVDSSGNLSVGTSTPQSGTKTLIISQTSDSSSYGLKVLSSNNSPLLLVRSDGKVSIATSGASYALNVSGDIYASGNLVVGGTFSAPIPAGNVTPGVFNSLQGGGTGAYAFLGSLGVATSSQVGLPQSLSVYGGGYFSGNVGIGTTNPGANLEIKSNSPILNINSDWVGGGYADIMFDTFSSTVGARIRAYIPGDSTTQLQFATMNNDYSMTTKMTILGNGNVGIGTTGPQSTLHVVGSGRYSANLAVLGGQSNSPGSGTLEVYGNGIIPILFVANTGARALQSAESIASFNAVNNTDTGTVVKISNNGTGPSLVVGGGNVGIGTTSPAYKLDVVGQINSSGGLCIAGDCKTSWSQVGGSSQWTNTTGGIYYLGNVGIGTSTVSYPLFISTSTDTLFAIRRTGASSPTIFKQGTDSAFVINNGGSDILTIKSGNVGIGTTSPGYKLDVRGTATINTDVSGPEGALLYLKNNGFSNAYYQFRSASGVGDNFVITNAGNVGIGTTTPMAKLSVNGSVDVGNNRIMNVAAPINNSDAATKAYVDALKPTFVGVTPTAYTGNLGGINGANAKCNAYSAGSHICSVQEYRQSGTTSSVSCWIHDDSLTPNNSTNLCVYWSSSGVSYYGPTLTTDIFNSVYVSYQACTNSLSICCCR